MTGDQGGVALVLLGSGAVSLMLALAVTALGQFLVGAAQAQNAADAAALAAAPVTFRPFGATGTAQEEAARFAVDNGATLVRCLCPQDPSWEPRTVDVTVARRFSVILFGRQTVEASSRAEFVPARLLQ